MPDFRIDTPEGGTIPIPTFRDMPGTDQLVIVYGTATRAAEAAKLAAECATAAEGIAGRAARSAEHANASISAAREANREQLEAVRREFTDTLGRSEAATLEALSKMSSQIAAASKFAERACVAAEAAEDAADRTGKRHVADLEKRASRGDELEAEVVKAGLGVVIHRQKAKTITVARVVLALVTILVPIFAAWRGCGG